MGLSIHDRGEFNPERSLREMIGEIKDIAIINNWKYFVFETDFPGKDSPYQLGNKEIYNPEKVYGIYFTPHLTKFNRQISNKSSGLKFRKENLLEEIARFKSITNCSSSNFISINFSD